jgi:hypothetical protein
MEPSALWDVLRRDLEAIREQYVAEGRVEEFDRYVAALKESGHWPFRE